MDKIGSSKGQDAYFSLLEKRPDTPLYVDLDGTLIFSDLLIEGLLQLIRTNPLTLFLIPMWLMKGKSYLKTKIAERVRLDVSSLPYNLNMVKHLEKASQMRKIYLATGSHEVWGKLICEHWPFFTACLATSAKNNLIGMNKLDEIRRRSADFHYIGNDVNDLVILKAAKGGLYLGKNFKDRKNEFTDVFHEPSGVSMKDKLILTLRGLRVHQWLKNLLIFIPALVSHRFVNPTVMMESLVGFISFSLMASGVYVLNDLIDVGSDRLHTVKKNRVFASGALSLSYGVVLATLLPILAFGVAMYANATFIWGLAFYYLVTMAYTFKLKKIILLDVMTLALLYTMRIVCGHLVTGIDYSFWLFSFSIFFFLSLAFIKRYTELLGEEPSVLKARGYVPGDIHLVSQFGITSGYLSILVLVLYISSAEVMILYHHPEGLWLCCFFLLYWISRLWFLTGRGLMHSDPIVYAAKDKVSYFVLILIALVVIYAK